jgi:hypothetical protein
MSERSVMAKTNTAIGGSAAALVSTAEILKSLGDFLAEHASKGVSARITYGNLLEELLVRFEFMPSGAQLMEIIQSFNRRQESGHATLPLGTAGTAAEAVVTFRNKVAKGYRSRLPLESLSPDMSERVASLFDSIIKELKTTIELTFNAEIEAAKSEHEKALSTCISNGQSVEDGLRFRVDALTLQLGESEALRESCERRVAESLASLESIQIRYQESFSKELVASATIQALGKRIDAMEIELAKVKLSEAEERRARLLDLDHIRQMELKLQRQALDCVGKEKELQMAVSRLSGEQERVKELSTQCIRTQALYESSQITLNRVTATMSGLTEQRKTKLVSSKKSRFIRKVGL